MADKPAKPEQILKIEPRNELHFKGESSASSGQRSPVAKMLGHTVLVTFQGSRLGVLTAFVCIVAVCLPTACARSSGGASIRSQSIIAVSWQFSLGTDQRSDRCGLHAADNPPSRTA